MTVAELLERLQPLPAEADVVLLGNNDGDGGALWISWGDKTLAKVDFD